MRYFLDAEFNGFGGDLISIAAVPEFDDHPPFYEAVICNRPVDWVRAHVLPVLQTRQHQLDEVALAFATYLLPDPHPIIVSDWPDDIAWAARLLADREAGRRFSGPVTFELLGASDFSSALRSQLPHNAYYDALALRESVLLQERV